MHCRQSYVSNVSEEEKKRLAKATWGSSLVCLLSLPQAIHGYRETEKLKWNEDNQKILQRVRELAFPPGVPQIAYVHVLDISKDGYIKPHVDAVRVRNCLPAVSILYQCIIIMFICVPVCAPT